MSGMSESGESISSTFYKQLLHQFPCPKKLQSQTLLREKHLKKVACKMLVNLTSGESKG